MAVRFALSVIGFALVAEPTPVVPKEVWKGSVDDAALMNEAPSFITDAKTLEKLWTTWKRDGDPPAVDFKEHFVVVATTRGSILEIRLTKDDQGDLKILTVSSRDLRPGFRYILASVPRAGVKTVNGKKLQGI
ncbi:MAG: hypothetical protein NZM29_04065 [Nitrospira sp.]|nr:hypothetical protein [Nitrospira sp.]